MKILNLIFVARRGLEPLTLDWKSNVLPTELTGHLTYFHCSPCRTWTCDPLISGCIFIAESTPSIYYGLSQEPPCIQSDALKPTELRRNACRVLFKKKSNFNQKSFWDRAGNSYKPLYFRRRFLVFSVTVKVKNNFAVSLPLSLELRTGFEPASAPMAPS